MSNLPAQQNNSALTVIENMVSSGNFDVNVARELIENAKRHYEAAGDYQL